VKGVAGAGAAPAGIIVTGSMYAGRQGEGEVGRQVGAEGVQE